jgi:hypothetical protein
MVMLCASDVGRFAAGHTDLKESLALNDQVQGIARGLETPLGEDDLVGNRLGAET